MIVVEYSGDFKLIHHLKRFKPLLILIVCMCIFVSASCIYASDIDDVATNNGGTVDVGSLADEGSGSITTDLDDYAGNSASDIDAISDDVQHYKMSEKDIDGKNAILHHKISHNPNDTGCKRHHHHHENNTSAEEAKLDYELIHKNNPETIQIDERIIEFGDGLQGGDRQINNVGEKGDLPNSIDIKEYNPNNGCEKTIADNIETTWISGSAINNRIFLKFANLHKSMGIESKLVKKDFCCCKHGHCNHNSDTNIHNHDKIIIAKNINNHNELAFSYNHNVKMYNSKACIICLRGSNEEEIGDARNRNFKNVLTIKYNEESNDDKFVKDFNAVLNMNAGDLAINFTDFDYDGLELSLNCDELNIKDYNLEYYIFTNPYIIINSINVEKHCFNSIKAKQTIAPTINYNHSPFTDCITHDNYDLSDYTLTTTFYDAASLIEVSAFNLMASKVFYSIGKLSLKLSNGMLAAIIISGDMKDV